MQQKLNLIGRLLMAQIFLLAGISKLASGLLVLSASGAGALSLDARRMQSSDTFPTREAIA